MEERDDPPYKVTNKRKLASKAASTEPEPQVLGDNGGVYIPTEEGQDDPGLDFGSFVISLGHNAYVAMGKVAHPETGETYEDAENARQMIEILDMLQKKTAGNLDTEEDRLLTGLLYELRLAFVEFTTQKV